MAYASKYYDPVKAHEYYMKHRQLKGRSQRASTASLNEAGKIAAKEVKDGIMAERKEAYERLKEQLKKEIDAIRRQIKNTKSKGRKEGLKRKIKALREKNKEERQKIKDEYQEKYLQELDKIKQDASFAKYKKGKRK